MWCRSLASLALKSGNAVILKGGSEAAQTNEVLVSIWRDCLKRFPAVPLDSISLLQSRAAVLELLAMDHDVDLIIPRGSYELVRFIMKHSRIPVLGHGEGICHVYVDRAADLQKAVDITYDAKVQYPAVCNAAETLLVDEAIAPKFLPQVVAKLKEAGVEIRGCAKTLALLPELRNRAGDRAGLAHRVRRPDPLDQSHLRRGRGDRSHQSLWVASHGRHRYRRFRSREEISE